MGAEESSTPCPPESKDGFQLVVCVLPCSKAHVALRVPREMPQDRTRSALGSVLRL